MVDLWARGISVASLVVSAVGLGLSRWDRRPRVWVYAHRATDTSGGSPFQSAHASAIGPGDVAIQPPRPDNLYLLVTCDREAELSKAWFQFEGQAMDVQSAQLRPPVRLPAYVTWHGWIPWRAVPPGISEAEAPSLGRATLTVTRDKVHVARPTPRNLLLGGRVPGPSPEWR